MASACSSFLRILQRFDSLDVYTYSIAGGKSSTDAEPKRAAFFLETLRQLQAKQAQLPSNNLTSPAACSDTAVPDADAISAAKVPGEKPMLVWDVTCCCAMQPPSTTTTLCFVDIIHAFTVQLADLVCFVTPCV